MSLMLPVLLGKETPRSYHEKPEIHEKREKDHLA